MKDYQEQLLIMWKDGVKTSPDKRMWTFWGSMFYCGTVFTTIVPSRIPVAVVTKQTRHRRRTCTSADLSLPVGQPSIFHAGTFQADDVICK
ncbi:hypothetical protein BIW11_04675 [Tropilaelaps mercedesae]|uniref:Uncharacterized protein n=1 Tax=Tropilaelaps mercedesae TaxID=418985 RepID=A0A1V9X399_9ACAR|nr:hypothetical protein BIW11_04675 [Tropilaelaps mercedesae]